MPKHGDINGRDGYAASDWKYGRAMTRDGIPRIPTTSSRNKFDAYYTPPELTRALLALWMLPAGCQIGEPCAGDGWISRELEQTGHYVRSGDLNPDSEIGREHTPLDFFSRTAGQYYDDVDAIITNPPYAGAPRFVRRALEFTDRVAMLLRLSFLEPCEGNPDSARTDLLDKLSRVIVLPRVSFIQGKSGTDSATCAWFIWEPGHRGRGWDMTFVSKRELAEFGGQQTLGDL
jgi:hypothetical protein